MKKSFRIAVVALLAAACCFPAGAQNSKKAASTSKSKGKQAVQQPAAPVRVSPTESITEVIDRIYNYLDSCTPYTILDGEGKELTDLSKFDRNTTFARGDFGINTYEWGVTYSGMLLASEVLGDSKYSDYVYERLGALGKIYPYVKNYTIDTGYTTRLNSLQNPKWLDDCGAMTAAMIKATLKDPAKGREFRGLLDNWFNFVMYKEYRFGDGILARNRPTTNSVWLDDMYMGITPIAYRGRLSQSERGDLTQKFYAEAINQVLLFKKYLWIPEKGMYRHGWIEGMSEHPDYHWARCNGWAVLTMCDVLDAVPPTTQGYNEVLETLTTLLRTLASFQSPEGTWHQLIDKTESYLETSASAMFVYGFAHAINKGWLDKTAYQDIAKAGWNGVAKQVNEKGQVENTCTGTGLGWTNTFYEARPVSVFAAHGYGPVLLAGAEMLKLYGVGQKPAGPGAGRQMAQGAPAAGQIPGFARGGRQEGKPMVFLAGDSTCKNGQGNGSNGQWGWGSFFSEYLTDGVVVENDAVGGLSSRTFYDNNWAGVRDQIKEGDYVLINLGHNDMAPLGTGRARGTLNGTDSTPQSVVMEKNGMSVDVYSYGWYIRSMVRQTKMRGGIPIVISPSPQNRWQGENQINRLTNTYNAWCKQVAAEEGVKYIDLNDTCGAKYEKIGKTAAQKDYFSDSVHTKEKGARLYCETIVEGLKAVGSPLAAFAK